MGCTVTFQIKRTHIEVMDLINIEINKPSKICDDLYQIEFVVPSVNFCTFLLILLNACCIVDSK